MMKKEEIEKLANDHWNYVESVLVAHSVDTLDELIAKHHYVTAFIHGFKHGVESLQIDLK